MCYTIMFLYVKETAVSDFLVHVPTIVLFGIFLLFIVIPVAIYMILSEKRQYHREDGDL